MNALAFLLTEQTRRATKLGVFGAIRVRVERSDDARSDGIRERLCVVWRRLLKIFEFSASMCLGFWVAV